MIKFNLVSRVPLFTLATRYAGNCLFLLPVKTNQELARAPSAYLCHGEFTDWAILKPLTRPLLANQPESWRSWLIRVPLVRAAHANWTHTENSSFCKNVSTWAPYSYVNSIGGLAIVKTGRPVCRFSASVLLNWESCWQPSFESVVSLISSVPRSWRVPFPDGLIQLASYN